MKRLIGERRVRPPRKLDYAKAFLKDWETLSRSGRYDMRQLKEAILLIVANDAPLGPEWKNHPLRGGWEGYLECHVGGDFLLVYKLDDTIGRSGIATFVRAGTHSELFNE